MDLSSSSHEGIVALSKQLNAIPRNNMSEAIGKLAQSPKISMANLLVIFKFMSIFGKSDEFFLNFKEHISSEKQKLNLATHHKQGKNALLLDIGYSANKGHHEDYNHSIASELKKRKYEVNLGISFMNRISQNLHDITDNYYGFLSRAYHSEFRQFSISQIQSMNDAYFLDLEINLGTYAPDLLICHSANELQIAGLGKWLNSKSKSKDIKVYIGLMDMGTSQNEKRNTDIYEFVEHSFKTIENISHCTIHLGTQNEFFQTEFEKRFGRKLYYFPLVEDLTQVAPKKNIVEFEKDLPVIGYFGATNKKKGIIELLEAIKKYELDKKINWIIQVDLEELKKISSQAFETLKAISSSKNVRVVNGFLERSTYLGLFAKAEYIIIPYDLDYVNKGSGIIAEAVFLNKKLLVVEPLSAVLLKKNNDIISFEFKNLEKIISKNRINPDTTDNDKGSSSLLGFLETNLVISE